MKFDLRKADKSFDFAYVPNGGTPMTYHLGFDLSPTCPCTGFKYNSTLMRDGATVQEATGEVSVQGGVEWRLLHHA